MEDLKELDELLRRLPARIADLRKDIDLLWSLTRDQEGSGVQEEISAILLGFNLIAGDLLWLVSRLKGKKQ